MMNRFHRTATEQPQLSTPYARDALAVIRHGYLPEEKWNPLVPQGLAIDRQSGARRSHPQESHQPLSRLPSGWRFLST